MAVTFNYTGTKFRFRSTQFAKQSILKIFADHSKKVDHISVIVCSDEFLLQVNRQFLKHDFLTDVITFDLSANTGIVGEIYISIDRIRENAKTYKTGFLTEAHRVIFHGALHLVGYKDKTTPEIQKMREAEQRYVSEIPGSFHVKQKNND